MGGFSGKGLEQDATLEPNRTGAAMSSQKTFRAIGDEEMLQASLDQRRRALKQQLARDFEEPRQIIQRAQQLVEDPGRLEPHGLEPTPDELHEAERIINGNNEMVHSHFFERGIRAARSVARVSRRDAAGNVSPEGTGSLVSPRLLMTNSHVIKDAGTAARSVVDFGYELDISGSEKAYHRWTLQPDTFFATDAALDVTLVAVVPPADAPVEHATEVGYCVLTDAESALTIGEFVNVVQHPGGQRKQVAFRENRLLERSEDVLWYAADTLPGSSGAPVFNDQWVMVALHRRSIPRRDGEVVLNKDGSVHQKGEPDDRVDWIANEGVRLSAVRRWMATLSLDGEQAALRDAVLAEGS